MGERSENLGSDSCDKRAAGRDATTTLTSPTNVFHERRFPRFTVELPCLYSIDDGPDWNGTAINLSRGGCAIIGTTPVERGAYLRILIFPSTSTPPIEIGLAPVRWVTHDQFGVEFITIASRDCKRLQAYLTFLETE